MSIRISFARFFARLAMCAIWFVFAISAVIPSEAVAASLNVQLGGLGSGTVTSVPAGISCGSYCYSNYPKNTSITLTATPTAGSSFSGWSGACVGTGMTVNVVLTTRSTTCTATFNLASPPTQLSLTVTRTGTGSGTVNSAPAGISCGSACSYAYAQNTAVSLTATAAVGSTFTGWSGSCTGTTANTSIVVNASSICLANFAANATTQGTANLIWEPVLSAVLSGYRVYYGTAPGVYQQPLGQGLDAGAASTFSLSGLSGGIRYYFAVTAYDASQNESGFSNEAVKDIP